MLESGPKRREISIQQQQETRGANVAVDENFQNYLIDYLLDREIFEQRYPFVCVEPLGQNQAVVYVEQNQLFTGESKEVNYNKVPRCYGLMASQELEETGVMRVRRSPQFALRGQGTLVGIIDTGIALTNPLFRYEDGTTKVRALWDQENQEGKRPEGFPFGTQWEREEIDQALKDNPGILPGDEEGHGTFLAAIAAGREDSQSGFSGVAPDSELLVVRLKRPKKYLLDFYSIEDDVWACQEDDVIMAIRYVLTMAMFFQKPVSICLGIGTNLGGHAGNGNLERYISASSLFPGVSFHIAAGNEGISGHHFHGEVPLGQNFQEVEFNVAEGEAGFVMELWGNAPVPFTVALLSPGGERVERIQLKVDEFRRIHFFPEKTELQIRSFIGETVGGEQVIRMNFRAPSAGIWKMEVYAAGEGNRSYDIWMPISNFLKEETFFLDATATETVTSPGDAFYGITYVPYGVDNDSLYVRASQGYTRSGQVKPDLAAPGVNVEAALGNRTVNRSGSSVAAAFGAGIGALMQEWAFTKFNDLSLNGQNMRYYLTQGAVQSKGYTYPNRFWGYGMVNLYDAFLSMRR